MQHKTALGEKVPESLWDILHAEITTGRVNLFLGYGLAFCHQAAAGSRGVGQRPVLLYSKLVGEFAKHATKVRKR